MVSTKRFGQKLQTIPTMLFLNENSIAELSFWPNYQQLSWPGGHGRALCCALCWHLADSRRFLSNISPGVQLHWSGRLILRLQWHHQCHTSRHSLFLRSVPSPCDSCQDVCVAHITSGTSQDAKSCLFISDIPLQSSRLLQVARV